MVTTIGTQAPYLGTQGTNTTSQDAQRARQDQTSDQSRLPARDSVNLSAAAQAVLNGGLDRVNSLLADKGEDIYRNALKDARQYKENLALALESSDLDPDTARETQIRMIERERAAFTAPEHTGDVLIRARAYIEFFDSLSPEEQESERYRGTRETMAAIVEQESAARGLEAPDLTRSQSPFDTLLDALSETGFTADDRARQDDALERFRAQGEQSVGSEAYQAERRDLQTRLAALNDLIERSRKGDDAAFKQLESLAIRPVSEADQ